MAIASNLGYPRIGIKRELKQAVEGFWRKEIDAEMLEKQAREIRQANWLLQKELGLSHIPSNDFSLYDHVLDTIAMVGSVPERFGWDGDQVDHETYFGMARGLQHQGGTDIAAMEMTKWFDTNYHYIVPEFEEGMTFRCASTKPVDEFLEASKLGVRTRPVLLGPVSFLLLGKSEKANTSLKLLGQLLPVYIDILSRLHQAGAEWVQIDEPFLAMDLSDEAHKAYLDAYNGFENLKSRPKILLTTYFAPVGDNLLLVQSLPADGLHLDLVRAPDQLERVLSQIDDRLILSLGLVDGRNIWKTDLDQAISIAEKTTRHIGEERIMIAPSCSLLHVPQDLSLETRLDREIVNWLAFGRQKIEELVVITNVINGKADQYREILSANRVSIASRSSSEKVHLVKVRERLSKITAGVLKRNNPYPIRQVLQQDLLKLPLFPTTTIGSFPQTQEVRRARARLRKGQLDRNAYEGFIKTEIEQTIRFQEEIGLDVLVHGEFERNDMVQYFGEQLSGFAFTDHGWVQSFGSRYVRPPMIYGDVARPDPMTVEWAKFSQGLTKLPLKGMLTGPITILQWSFVRNDQPRSATCRQIALAIRDEVRDLETSGISIIQIDEPALREGLPLRRSDWDDYLTWAVECFRLASSGVRDDTQIHTHMCYSEFNDIIDSIAALDADVISIEASRSKMDLLEAFVKFHYPNAVGPGVYDIHSPRVPGKQEILSLLQKALKVIPAEQLWINPDCGLKTRGWEETRESLTNLVQAARELRSRYKAE